MEHYRNYNAYVPETRATRMSDTVEFFPANYNMPTTSSADNVEQLVTDLLHEIQQPRPPSPFSDIGTRTSAALQRLTDIFKRKLTTTATRPPHKAILFRNTLRSTARSSRTLALSIPEGATVRVPFAEGTTPNSGPLS